MNTKHQLTVWMTAGGLFAGVVCGAAKDDVTSYPAPKGHPPISQTAGATCPAQGVKMNGAPLHWTTPAGWKELPATAIRIGNFIVTDQSGKKAEVAITSFPGTVGTELDNVNRWRGELGLEPLEQGAVTSEAVNVDSLPGKLYTFSGASADTVVVSLPRGGATWFFKLRGDKTVVDGAKPAFLNFLKSVHFL